MGTSLAIDLTRISITDYKNTDIVLRTYIRYILY